MPSTAAEIPVIDSGQVLYLDEDVRNLRLNVEWITKVYGIVCDLDLTVYCYDDRARLVEKLDSTYSRSSDGCCILLSDLDVGSGSNAFYESVKIEIGRVSNNVEAFLLLINGGPRNFQHVKTVGVQCFQIPGGKAEKSISDAITSKQTKGLYQFKGKARKDFNCVAIGLVFKDGWYHEDAPRWAIKSFLEPITVFSTKEIEEKCLSLVVDAVPVLQSFRLRLFNNVRDICTALSSTSLPKLKKKFLKSSSGLPLLTFTEVLFKQLYESHPKIIEDNEAPSLVALLQEVFNQIDYNGDTFVDWDEFTTFIIQNSLINGMSNPSSSALSGNSSIAVTSAKSNSAGIETLDEYVIEYGEDMLLRDHILSSHRTNSVMRYIPDNGRILIIPDDSDNIVILDENFKLISNLYPLKVQVANTLSNYSNISSVFKPDKSSVPFDNENNNNNDDEENEEDKAIMLTSTHIYTSTVATHSNSGKSSKLLIYDIIYISGKDLYAFSLSDHTITICKEHISVSGKNINYFYYNKFYHSIASDHNIYGWEIDKPSSRPLFIISRHSDIITDFICADNLDCFITCSMDKRIVMWSTISRRVKALFTGHKRGVRSLSHYDTILLSAGYECEARTWDMNSKEPLGLLKGHRYPIVSAKLMCDLAYSEKDYRAITVDEKGEFRLWNIYIKEKSNSSDHIPVPTLQIFEMSNRESPLDNIRFLAIPYNSKYVAGYYSDIIACSTKLLRFLPEKNSKEFLPPAYSVFNEATSTLYTANGKSLLKYDICYGNFICSFPDLHYSELSYLHLDGIRGRRIYAGCRNGDLLLVNCTTGSIIGKCIAHNKEITGIVSYSDESKRNFIYTCSVDGKIRSIEETAGTLSIQNTIENAFGEGISITSIKLVTSLSVLIATSSGKAWGIWNETSFKKIIILHESDLVLGLEVLGSSHDEDDMTKKNSSDLLIAKKTKSKKESLVTLVVALYDRMHVYTVDVVDIRGLVTCRLLYSISSEHSISLNIPKSSNDNENDGDRSLSARTSRGSKRTPRKTTPNTASSIDITDNKKLYFTDLKLMNFPKSNESVNNSKQMISKNRCQGTQLVACTDDGLVFIWNINDIRWKSVELFRKTYDHLPVLKPDIYFLREPSPLSSPLHSPKPLTARFRAPKSTMHKNTVTFFPFQGSDVSSPQNITSPKSDDDKGRLTPDFFQPTKLSSHRNLRSTLITIVDNDNSIVSPTSHTKLQLHPTSHNTVVVDEKKILHNKSIENIREDEVNDENGSEEVPNKKKTLAEYNVSLFHVLPHKEILPDIYPTHAFIAHSDSCSNVVSMTEHGCFLTVSIDGYHRIWNSDQECLGELPLPNLTEKMKIIPSYLPTIRNYKFVLEKITITKAHKDMAILLVDNIKNKNKTIIQSSINLNKSTSDIDMFPLTQSSTTSSKNTKSGSILISGSDRRFANTSSTSKDLRLLIQDNYNKNYDINDNNELSNIRINVLKSLHSNDENDSNDKKNDIPVSPNLLSPYKFNPDTNTIEKVSPKTKEEIAASFFDIKSPEGSTKSLSSFNTKEDIFSPKKLITPIKNNIRPSHLPTPINNSMKILDTSTHRQSMEKLQVDSLFTSSNSLWINLEDSLHGLGFAPPAFSEASLVMGMNEGLLDSEGYHLLKSMNISTEKLLAYDRQPTVLLRNPALSVSFEMPPKEGIHRAEVNFGSQKDMYKNAKELLGKSNKLSLNNMRNAIALQRVEASANKIKSMIQIIPALQHDEVIITKDKTSKFTDNYDDDISLPSINSEFKSKMRLLYSHSKIPEDALENIRPLDQEFLQKQLLKVEKCLEDDINDNNMNNNIRKSPKRYYRKMGKKVNKDRLLISKATQEILEKKLAQAMKDGYKTKGLLKSSAGITRRTSTSNDHLDNMILSTSPVVTTSLSNRPFKFKLTTRYLLPYYKLDDINKFIEIFSQVDEDYSGDLDSSEWVRLFSSINKNISSQEARMMFMKIDSNNTGSISLRNLIPVVFSKANNKQIWAIIHHAESEIIKKIDDKITYVTHLELEQLFEAYDLENIGFISIELIKDRVRSFNLPDKILYLFLDSLFDVNTDEMVNLIEFKRIFQMFIKIDKN